jgi:hypothetical protein
VLAGESWHNGDSHPRYSHVAVEANKENRLEERLSQAVEDVVMNVTTDIEAVPLDALSYCSVPLLGVKSVLHSREVI